MLRTQISTLQTKVSEASKINLTEESKQKLSDAVNKCSDLENEQEKLLACIATLEQTNVKLNQQICHEQKLNTIVIDKIFDKDILEGQTDEGKSSNVLVPIFGRAVPIFGHPTTFESPICKF